MLSSSIRMIAIIGASASCFLAACNSNTAKIENPSATPTKSAEVPVVRVQEQRLNKLLEVPGELRAFQNVAIEAKVEDLSPGSAWTVAQS